MWGELKINYNAHVELVIKEHFIQCNSVGHRCVFNSQTTMELYSTEYKLYQAVDIQIILVGRTIHCWFLSFHGIC